jgi:hypothetical protein
VGFEEFVRDLPQSSDLTVDEQFSVADELDLVIGPEHVGDLAQCARTVEGCWKAVFLQQWFWQGHGTDFLVLRGPASSIARSNGDLAESEQESQSPPDHQMQ